MGIRWRPVAYWSRKLKDPETRYCATDLEWLAAVTAVTRVWYWLLDGKPFLLCSDHQALSRKLCRSGHDPPLNDRQSRWVESMSRFSYTFQWLKGEDNRVADALSRQPVAGYTTTVVQALLVGLWGRLRWAAERDPVYQRLKAQADGGTGTYRMWKGLVADAQGRLVVPDDDELKTLILSENHFTPYAGHFGAEKTQELVQRHWTWSGLPAM